MKLSVRREGSKGRLHCGREAPEDSSEFMFWEACCMMGEDNLVSGVDDNIQLTGTHGNSGYHEWPQGQ